MMPSIGTQWIWMSWRVVTWPMPRPYRSATAAMASICSAVSLPPGPRAAGRLHRRPEALHAPGVVREGAVALGVGTDGEHDVGILGRLAEIRVEHDQVRHALERGARAPPGGEVRAVEDQRTQVRRREQLVDRAVGCEALEAEALGVRVLVGLDQEVVVEGPGRRPGDAGHPGVHGSADAAEQVDLLVRRLRRDHDADPAFAEARRDGAERALPGCRRELLRAAHQGLREPALR